MMCWVEAASAQTLRAGALSTYLSLLHGSNIYAATTATANLLNLANISAFK